MGFATLGALKGSSSFNPGKKDRKLARKALKGMNFSGGNMFGAGGLGGGFSFDSAGNFSSNQSLGAFQPLFEAMMQSSGQGFEGMSQILSQMQGQTGGLEEIFGSASKIAAQDPMQRGEDFASNLRARRAGSARSEINNTFDRLFASGGLSNQTTREQTLDAESRRLADEDLGFDMAGAQFGEASVQNAFARAMGSNSQLGSMAQLFGNVGNTGAANATAMSQLPMQFMKMIADLQGGRNQGIAMQAGGFTNNASGAIGDMQALQGLHSQDVVDFNNFTSGMSNIFGGMGGGIGG